jgi:TATA element modulatory factor
MQRSVRSVDNAPNQVTKLLEASHDLSRSSSTASAGNDRLQERLARAMAKKNASRTDSPVPTSIDASADLVARDEQASPEPACGQGTEQQLPTADAILKTDAAIKTEDEEAKDDTEAGPVKEGEDTTTRLDSTQAAPTLMLQSDSDPARASTQNTPGIQVLSNRPSEDASRPSIDSQSRRVAEDVLETQAEMNAYLERIDALRRTLQTLVDSVSDSARKSAEAARQGAASAEHGSLEQKLSQKDEKIALLIEEGTRWSKTEMDLRSTIKKIRTQATANAKEHETTKGRAERAERNLRAMEDRARRAEATGKRVEQSLAVATAEANDTESLKKERTTLNATIAEMQSQLLKANARADAAENKAQSEQLEKERARTAELQDELNRLKVDRELSDEKLQRQIKDLQAALDREKEQAQAMESEMLGEQAALESKLESFRVRAEEASSADTGHSHAKLLRQIETLQNQYAAASQNWQGIESSLVGRITNLEKERDDVVTREADVRKKLRDTTLKLKNAERELDGTQNQYADMDKSLADANEEVQRSQRKTNQLEKELATVQKDLQAQKENLEREIQRRLDEEKSKWMANLHIPRTESPAASIRKTSALGFDMNHLMSPTQLERPTSRRSSVLPNSFDSYTPPRLPSTTNIRGMTNGSIAETPSVPSMDPDEYFANVPPTPMTPSHHSQRGGVNELISTSTVGAGPSVQLVERMSANVRRLESEKAATKDELVRLSTQRDEARQEVVSLMREVEEKRKIEQRLKTLEADHAGLSQRHQTTLELLGEKSEQVEELKADILDVKQMYRQLADTMK